MLYLLDANVLIDANRDYYPLGRVPEFWHWLVDRATEQQVKVPLEVYEEVLAGKDDDLTRWLKKNRDALLLDEDVDETLVARVTDRGYAPDLTDEEVELVGRDPFSHRLRARQPRSADRRHHRGFETEETAREPPHPGRV